MHLNCAFVSSILFVSAVLAGNHPENQQPPFLDRVEKSINTTDELPITFWAGAVRRARSQIEVIDYAAATFMLPSAWGVTDSESAFNIIVGIGGYKPCEHFTLNIAIVVTVTRDGVSYKVWGQGYNGNVMVAPRWFRVSTGQEIRAIVRGLTPRSGFLVLINLTTGRAWVEYVSGAVIPICSQDAAWIITPPKGHVTLPNFYPLTFGDVLTRISGVRRVPDAPDVVNIFQNNRAVTHTQVIESYIIVYYVN